MTARWRQIRDRVLGRRQMTIDELIFDDLVAVYNARFTADDPRRLDSAVRALPLDERVRFPVDECSAVAQMLEVVGRGAPSDARLLIEIVADWLTPIDPANPLPFDSVRRRYVGEGDGS